MTTCAITGLHISAQATALPLPKHAHPSLFTGSYQQVLDLLYKPRGLTQEQAHLLLCRVLLESGLIDNWKSPLQIQRGTIRIATWIASLGKQELRSVPHYVVAGNSSKELQVWLEDCQLALQASSPDSFKKLSRTELAYDAILLHGTNHDTTTTLCWAVLCESVEASGLDKKMIKEIKAIRRDEAPSSDTLASVLTAVATKLLESVKEDKAVWDVVHTLLIVKSAEVAKLSKLRLSLNKKLI